LTVQEPPKVSLARLVFVVLGPFACGYFMSYLFRAVNAVVAPDLVAEIGLSASELGLLTSAYLLAFALFQLPLGVLLDRFGPRRVQAALLVFCAAVGALVFAIGDSALVLTLGRALIGLGFAGGLMAGFKAVVLWVPEERRAFASTCVMAFGGLGILASTVPMEYAVQAWGWRAVFAGLAAITVAAGVLIFFVVPERPRGQAAPPTLVEQLAGVAHIFGSATFWRLVPLVALTAGSHVGIQTLWAGPWFRDVAGFDRETVALYLGMAAVAFLVGTLCAGGLADRLHRRGIDSLTVMVCILGVYFVAEALIIAQFTALTEVMWIVFAMTGQASVLAYPWLASYFGAAFSGRANTALNLIMFGCAFAAQYAIGAVIDLYPVTPEGGYDPRGYQAAFGTLLALQILALGWFLLDRPRLPKRQSGSL
jgi:MFS family permease